MKSVRLGIVGCGLFGESHLLAFRAVHNAEVTAAYDPSQARAKELARRYGIPKVCGTLGELCASSGVDAVDVVTPEETHLEPVLRAIQSGKHVFVEKPFATNLDHCTEMIQAAKAADKILMVGHILRFETKFVLLKQELDTGRLGNVVSMQARRNRPKSLLGRYGRTHPALENSIHDIDLMLWYTGDRVQRVRGYGRKVTGGKHHDAFWGILEFAKGAFGILETIWLLPQSAGITLDDAFQLIGDRGVGNISLVPGAMSFWHEEGFEIPDSSYDPRLRGAVHGALRDELSYFCDCVANHHQPEVVSPIEAKNAVRIALALVESSEVDHEITIKNWD
jgi:predicted dehydrogenase